MSDLVVLIISSTVCNLILAYGVFWLVKERANLASGMPVTDVFLMDKGFYPADEDCDHFISDSPYDKDEKMHIWKISDKKWSVTLLTVNEISLVSRTCVGVASNQEEFLEMLNGARCANKEIAYIKSLSKHEQPLEEDWDCE